MNAKGELEAQVIKKKLLYRARHRGTREMDWLVGRFVAESLETLKDEEQKGLALLLDLSDADIYDLLYGGMKGKVLHSSPALAKMAADDLEKLGVILDRMQQYYQIGL